MSSPTSSSHEVDTPVSGGSPAGSPSSSRSPAKDETPPSKCSSPKINGDSCSSSPTATPTPTPPANGILTPPPTDGDNVSETEKPENPAGRLKFYKHGILCLELSHHNEGERTKWVQIRTKTVFPTVVHTTKEATIPCHVSPQSFTSPSSSNVLQSRVESSTSHSMSDDGSSMLSSPRLRENIWKQPVPQKGVSSCLEFFMKPAVCVLNLRKLFFEKSKSQVIKLNSKPYDYQITSFLRQSTEKHLCSCEESATDEQSCLDEKSDDVVDGTVDCKNIQNGSSSVDKSKVCKRTKARSDGKLQKISILVIAERLKCERELKLKEDSENGDLIKHTIAGAPNSRTLPKKRMFKEMDTKDTSSSAVRPKKKSPNRNNDSKTILNVPGLNSEFYRRHSIPVEVNTAIGQKHNNNAASFCGKLSPSTTNYKSSNKAKNGVTSGKRSENNSPYHIKSLSPNRNSKKTISSEVHDVKGLNNQNPYSSINNSAMCISSLPPQEQEIFQRQTMSKAISYTINSLLNSPGSSETGNKHSLLKSNNNDPAKLSTKTSKLDKSVNHSSSNSNIGNVFQGEVPPGLFGARDQNSFLRHLLDTSDPIPSVKPERNSTAKQATKNPSNSRHNSKTSTPETNSVPVDLKKCSNSSSSGKTKSSNSIKHHAVVPQNNNQLGQYPPLIHPSLVNSGFPLALNTAYDSFLRSQDPSSSNALAAAAAAAAFQYGSLLPQHLFSNLNSTMAAAVAASYLGGSQNLSAASSQPLLSTRSPPISHSSSSPINYSSSSSSPLNLSQRAWPGGVNGLIPCSGTIPVPFHAPIGDNIHSVGSASRQSHSRERLEKLNEIIDNDTPLNLSKKPRPS